MSQDDLVEEGLTRLERGELHAAASSFRKVVERDPRHVPALTGLGEALARLDQFDEAEALYHRALAAHPRHPIPFWNLGQLLCARGRMAEALALGDAAVAQDPGFAEGWSLRGDGLTGLDRQPEARESYTRAAALEPDNYDILWKLGAIRAALGDCGAALEILNRAITAHPERPEARLPRALARLALRDFGGWADFEARFLIEAFVRTSGGPLGPAIFSHLTLSPTAAMLAGQRILVIGEQGLGDEVMFASAIPDALRVAKKLVYVGDQRLQRLFSASFPEAEVMELTSGAAAKLEVDRVIAVGSLPAIFRTREQDFPGAPYLRPRAEVVAGWARRLGPAAGRLRVGLSWRGGSPVTGQGARSVPLEALGPILDLPGCEFVSLQYGEVEAEVAAFNAGWANPVRCFPAEDIRDLEDLAAVLENLDVVVSVQTTLAHLAGAVGRPCLAMIPANPAWRYGASGPTMPWYGSVRLFRQAEPGDWGPVIETLAGELRTMASPGGA